MIEIVLAWIAWAYIVKWGLIATAIGLFVLLYLIRKML